MYLHKDKVFEQDKVYWEPMGANNDTNGTVIDVYEGGLDVDFGPSRGIYSFTSKGFVRGGPLTFGWRADTPLEWRNIRKEVRAGRDGQLHFENVTLGGASSND